VPVVSSAVSLEVGSRSLPTPDSHLAHKYDLALSDQLPSATASVRWLTKTSGIQTYGRIPPSWCWHHSARLSWRHVLLASRHLQGLSEPSHRKIREASHGRGWWHAMSPRLQQLFVCRSVVRDGLFIGAVSLQHRDEFSLDPEFVYRAPPAPSEHWTTT
jgi:hypothetical protein